MSALFPSREEPLRLAVRSGRLDGGDKPGDLWFASEFYIPVLRVRAFTAEMGGC